jgi:AraC family L-rhamnose operon regulatory protein RhaS
MDIWQTGGYFPANHPFMKRTTFRTARELFHADTCEPLRAAAARGEVRLAAVGRGSYPGERLPRHDLRELCMAGYWDAPRAQHWGLDWHCNEGIEIGYLSAGRLPFAVAEKSYDLVPGDLTITRPWQRHRVGNPHVPANHYSWVIIDVGVRRPNQPWHWPAWLLASKGVLRRLTDMLRQNEQPVWHSDRRIAGCFARIDETVALGTGEAARAGLKIAVNELLILLGGMLESTNPQLDKSLSGSERTVRLFLDNLHQRLDEPWSLESMAAACGLGRTHFSTCCRRTANVTPLEFLTRSRIDEASRLLEHHGELSITDIAFRCGFQSSQYFSRVFRQYRGMAPSDLRRVISSGGRERNTH